jgi:hypothetical protein
MPSPLDKIVDAICSIVEDGRPRRSPGAHPVGFYGVAGLQDQVGVGEQPQPPTGAPGQPSAPTWSPPLVALAHHNSSRLTGP